MLATRKRRTAARLDRAAALRSAAGTRGSRIVALLAFALLPAGCADRTTEPTGGSVPVSDLSLSGADAPGVRDRYIVVLKPGENAWIRAGEIAATSRGRVLHLYGSALSGFSLRAPASAIDGIRRNPHVAFVEPDFVVQAQAQTLPTGVDRIETDHGTFNPIDGVDTALDVDIAVLDSGIDRDHPDLRVVPTFRNCVDTNDDDVYGHGTHVAGILAARDDGEGVVGVAAGARLWPVKVLDDYGSGTLSSVICGIDFVTANAAEIEVANVSLGATMWSDALHTAIRNSVAAGVVYVAAAGNGQRDIFGADGVFGTTDDFIPAAYPEVAAISAIADSDGRAGGSGNSLAPCGTAQQDDTFACFSNHARSVAPGNPVSSPGGAIDLAAPGVAILSTYAGATTRTMDGTSMAAPHVAGAAALLIAERGTRDLNGDGVVNAADVYAVRQALIDRAEAQTAWRADGATLDRDANREGMVRIAAPSTSEPPPPPPSLPVPPQVTPDAGSATATGGSTGNVADFTVANQHTGSESYALACAAAGQVLSCSAPATVTVAAGGTSTVPVTFAAGSAGSGTVTLTATGLGGSDGGSYTVTVTDPPPTAPGDVVHVHEISISTAFKAGNLETTARVTIQDLNESPVTDAQVVGDWYVAGLPTETGVAGTTNGKGQARIRSRIPGKRGDLVRFCVTSVSAPGANYDATRNHGTCAEMTASGK